MALNMVLFRVDAGPGIGLGHLQRSLSLATALEKLDVGSRFLVHDNSESRERIEQTGFASDALPALQTWSLDDARATQDAARSEGCATVIVDSHQVSSEYLAALRNAGLYSVARDDMADSPFPCQLVINGNADAKNLRYASSSGDTIFLLGTDYMVLDQEFWDWRLRADDRPVRNVLVTLGGTDEYDLMPQFLDSLDRMLGEISLTAVVGPFFENVDEVKEAASRMTGEVKLAHNPQSLRDAIANADLAVSAAGQTIYELARAGCPTVVFSIASNQQGQLEELAETGFVRVAGNAAKDDVVSGVCEAVRSLLEDSDSRSVMASAGRRLVDGQGARRVARTIVEITGSLNPDDERVT